MSLSGTAVTSTFGLLPEPERRPASFLTSAVINLSILALVLYIGMTAKHALDQHKYEATVLTFPTTPPPPLKLKVPPAPKVEPPKLPEVKLEPPKIAMPRIEPKPDVRPIQMETKMDAPIIKAVHPMIALAPQPKAALAAAAPAQAPQAKPSTAPVHLGETFGVPPNSNASRPATVAGLGNPYGGTNGPAVAPRGIVGSTGLGNGSRFGSNAGSNGGQSGKVASAGIPAMTTVAAPAAQSPARPNSTNLEVLSKPAVQYTAEARQLKIQGDVVLRVTFTAGGQVIVQGIVHGLGHGLDEEARGVAEQIRYRPATRDGQAVDVTTNITITFQLA